ncbi:MAG: hypothetical protein K5776_05660, partial [Lachnospiraceae bacterium]|nr:hypothetical protein [Lachnospiraceae bacterium]
TRKVLDSEYLTLPKGESVKSFSKNYGDYFIKEKDCLILKGLSNKKSDEVNLSLVPYYQAGNERYGIYWYLKECNNN